MNERRPWEQEDRKPTRTLTKSDGYRARRKLAEDEYYVLEEQDPHTDPKELWHRMAVKYDLLSTSKSPLTPEYELWRAENPGATREQKSAKWAELRRIAKAARRAR